jgi:hypothetical protein
VIAYDADAVTKEHVRIARSQLAANLRGRGALVGFLEWDGARGKGIDDHLAAVCPETVLDEIAHVDFAGSAWKKDLLRSKSPMNNTEGRILPVLANAIAAFRHAPEWGGVLAFNEFGFGTVVLKPAPWGVVPKGNGPTTRIASPRNGCSGKGFWPPWRLPGKPCRRPRGTIHFTQ